MFFVPSIVSSFSWTSFAISLRVSISFPVMFITTGASDGGPPWISTTVTFPSVIVALILFLNSSAMW